MAQSGTPFSVSFNSSPGLPSRRADLVPGAALYPTKKTYKNWFNSGFVGGKPACFSTVQSNFVSGMPAAFTAYLQLNTGPRSATQSVQKSGKIPIARFVLGNKKRDTNHG
jgi:hypothetical protein